MWFQSPSFSAFAFLTAVYGFVVGMSLKTDGLKRSSSEVNAETKTDLKDTYGEFYKSILIVNFAALSTTDAIVSALEVVRWENYRRSLKAHAKLALYLAVLYASCSYSFVVLFNAFLLRNLPSFLEPWLRIHVLSGYSLLKDSETEPQCEKSSQDSTTDVAPLMVDADVASPEKRKTHEHIGLLDETASGAGQTADQSSDHYCRGCDTSFGYILNRRHYCRHCGDHFCASCCNRYVPRYFFGATAPAAKTETVMVCLRCFEYLSDKFAKQTSENEDNLTTAAPSIN